MMMLTCGSGFASNWAYASSDHACGVTRLICRISSGIRSRGMSDPLIPAISSTSSVP